MPKRKLTRIATGRPYAYLVPAPIGDEQPYYVYADRIDALTRADYLASRNNLNHPPRVIPLYMTYLTNRSSRP